MHIENEVKLDFKDVLIRPKRSTLKSRSEVSLARTFTFKNSGKTWTGVPMIAANMDTTGTFEMAKVFAKHKMIVAMSKHIGPDEWIGFCKENPQCTDFVAVSSGTSDGDWQRLQQILASTPVDKICIDGPLSLSLFLSFCLCLSLSVSLSPSLLRGARSFSLLPLSVLGSCHGAFASRTFALAEVSRASMHLPTYISWV